MSDGEGSSKLVDDAKAYLEAWRVEEGKYDDDVEMPKYPVSPGAPAASA